MPSIETPPNAAPPTPPVRVRTNRYGDLEEHELIHLLDALDDERAKARFRESVYISIIIWLLEIATAHALHNANAMGFAMTP